MIGTVQPNHSICINMNIYIPQNVKMDKIILQFRLQNGLGTSFGDFLIGIIEIESEAES